MDWHLVSPFSWVEELPTVGCWDVGDNMGFLAWLGSPAGKQPHPARLPAGPRWQGFLARVSGRAPVSPLQAFVFYRYLVNTCVKRQKLTWDCRVASSEYIDSIFFFIKGSGSRRVFRPNFFPLKSLKYCSFINSLIHFDHQMYIEGRIVIPESTTNTSSSICPT